MMVSDQYDDSEFIRRLPLNELGFYNLKQVWQR